MTQLNMIIWCILLLTITNARAETVPPTVDTDPYRLTVKMIDFPNNKTENVFLFDSAYHGTRSCPGLLSSYLGEDNYPTNTENASMAALFSNAIPVNNLFLEKSDDWWLFDSTQCFATLRGDRFILYDELNHRGKYYCNPRPWAVSPVQ